MEVRLSLLQIRLRHIQTALRHIQILLGHRHGPLRILLIYLEEFRLSLHCRRSLHHPHVIQIPGRPSAHRRIIARLQR